MNCSTISADVISYTSLFEDEKRELETGIKELLSNLTKKYEKYSFYGRLVQGDYIECAIKSPEYALRIALLLKTYVKTFQFKKERGKRARLKYFNEHGIRLAIAVAPLETIDPENGIIDGEAIYLSGRAIKNLSSSNKQKIVIKNTMFFCSSDKKQQEQFDTLLSLLDTIISKCSAKQSEVLYYKLLGLSEKEISEKLKRYQSTVSQHSTAAGWLSIEKAVTYFENTIQ
ncbi:fumarate hydratase [Tenuifilum thalassicum]|uniref:Fumarate hydratase n=1 Tax=Tenuifilum thalassicum TaxID=2590900 RepID=A0A7D3XMM7_9BACT|nr:fumarate hydratase [Tenuifilum thalassicum]QKG80356.1 fumarate hydratase [Tenuifilum thalassicum]